MHVCYGKENQEMMDSLEVGCVVGDEVKSVSGMEGDSVTLHTDFTDIQRDEQIQWLFESQKSLIVFIDRNLRKTPLYNDTPDGRFKNRLQINNQTGDLTITNITTQHTGLYKMIIFGRGTYRFNVTVYAHLPIPVITRDSSKCSSCVLLCSVLNVRDVSLSWYKGNSLLSSISVSDLNIRLSLPLEVEYQDTNTYRCVLNNTNINQTQHLNITDLCQPCSDCVSSCATTEAVIRLVVSALMGVAAVAAVVVLIYDIRSRQDEQNNLHNFRHQEGPRSSAHPVPVRVQQRMRKKKLRRDTPL
ncbi:uncharacterized protein [Paramisgurnus dabryanus]|uniref:uncharacterized protein n=1 Tax=Paramisgurnus dabryanus TaxID=90735 RepID=UPI003CCF5D73